MASTPLLATICATRLPWLATRVRVRQWGRLPRRRGATILIANHQHEDESEIVVLRSFVDGPWRPLATASSRRMFEPGFFATRMPWSAPLTRRLDAGPLFRSIGLNPLENQLSSRPLESLALGVIAAHGDLPLGAVFSPAALEGIAVAGTRLSDLAHAHNAAAARTPVKLGRLREPYRSEALAALRAQVRADIASIQAIVRAGTTFFVTPEGFYSTDGRMRPLKGIVEQLLPLGRPWFAAIAFDPFRGRRLSLLYRVLEPAGGVPLAVALAAARPVTTSALLAPFLQTARSGFTAARARAAAAAQRASVPPAAFVDPEYDAGPERAVDDALAGLVRRGILIAAGGRFATTGRREDPRFPGVADIVAYQAAFLEETLAALRHG